MGKLENIFTDITLSLDGIKIIYDQRWEHWEVRYPEGGISCHSSLEEAVTQIQEHTYKAKNKTCHIYYCKNPAIWSIQYKPTIDDDSGITVYSCNTHICEIIRTINLKVGVGNFNVSILPE